MQKIKFANVKESRLFFLVCVFITIFIESCNTDVKNSTNKFFAISGKDISKKEIGARLNSLFGTIDTLSINNDSLFSTSLPLNEYVKLAYRLNKYQPIWFKDGRTLVNVENFLCELEEVCWDGFDPEEYNKNIIMQLLEKQKQCPDSLSLIIAIDTLLTRSYLDIAYDILMGISDPEIADPIWYDENDSMWDAPSTLARQIIKYPSLNRYKSNLPTYTLARKEYKRYAEIIADPALDSLIRFFFHADSIINNHNLDSIIREPAIKIIKRELPWLATEIQHSIKIDTTKSNSENGGVLSDDTAVQDSLSEEQHLIFGYQYYMHIKPTGKLDAATIKKLGTPIISFLKKLNANMERMRWMKHDIGHVYLFVDIPLMELFLRRNDSNLMNMRVVVGQPVRPTPSLSALMSNIVINPPWGVPPSILKNDVLPGIKKSGKKYLAKKGLKVYDKNGKLVNADLISAKNYKRYTYKQAPGVSNALGYVKFNLHNPFDIYLHDTPHRDDFLKFFRALSSGCIRVQKPQELAIYIISDMEKKNFDQEKLTKKIGTHKTESVPLNVKIPVHIDYLTVFDDSTSTHLRMLNDVYKHDSLLISILR